MGELIAGTLWIHFVVGVLPDARNTTRPTFSHRLPGAVGFAFIACLASFSAGAKPLGIVRGGQAPIPVAPMV